MVKKGIPSLEHLKIATVKTWVSEDPWGETRPGRLFQKLESFPYFRHTSSLGLIGKTITSTVSPVPSWGQIHRSIDDR